MSTYYLGQNLALTFMLLGVLFFMRNRKFWSGFAVGLGFCSAVNVLVAFAALIFLQWRWARKKVTYLLGGFLASAGSLHALFLFLSGEEFWKQVYTYHFAKPERAPQLLEKTKVFSFVSSTHLLLILLALAGVTLFLFHRLGKEREDAPPASRERLLMLSCSLVIANVLFLLFVNPIFLHYFLPTFPFLAILATELILRIWKGLRMTWKEKKPDLYLAIAILILCIASWNIFHGVQTYQKELVFHRFDHAQEIADRITEDLGAEETIYGGFDVVPVVAMLSGRRIAANEIDSSVMRYASGLYTIENLVKMIDADNVGAILARKKLGIGFYPLFREYVERNFVLKEVFTGPKSIVAVEYWRRR